MNREKSGNFEQSGKVREFYPKYWKNEEILASFCFYFFSDFSIEVYLLNSLNKTLKKYWTITPRLCLFLICATYIRFDHFSRCPVGYTGDICQTKVSNPCDYTTCENGGTCNKLADDKVECKCTREYSGKWLVVNFKYPCSTRTLFYEFSWEILLEWQNLRIMEISYIYIKLPRAKFLSHLPWFMLVKFVFGIFGRWLVNVFFFFLVTGKEKILYKIWTWVFWCGLVVILGERCERCALANGKEHICNEDVYGASCYFNGDHNAMCKCPPGYSNEYICDGDFRDCKGHCVVSIPYVCIPTISFRKYVWLKCLLCVIWF